MDEDVLNTSVRKFLKKVGVTSQREIEKAVREASADGRIKANDIFPATMTLHIAGLDLAFEIDGEIECG